MNNKIIAIVGPTASGKSDLAVWLARKLDGEIISADSMQVYRELNIGNAKITPQEMEGVVHHLIDTQSYLEEYHVKRFQELCRQAISQVRSRGKIPILCGGTGLYIKAALYDYGFEQEELDQEYLQALEKMDNETLYAMLQQEDEESALKIHPNNRKRVIRALQLAHTGLSKSEREKRQKHEPLYDIFFAGIETDRDLLDQRIEKRVDAMLEKGLEREVRTLFSDPQTWKLTSFQGIGYKEFQPLLEKKASLQEVRDQIILHTRQYAKRQMTWFRHQIPVHWFSLDQREELLKEIEQWMTT